MNDSTQWMSKMMVMPGYQGCVNFFFRSSFDYWDIGIFILMNPISPTIHIIIMRLSLKLLPTPLATSRLTSKQLALF